MSPWPAAVFFDCDGVILESTNIKTRAFQSLFGHEANHWPAIRRYHLSHAGISRFRKFSYIYSEILKRPFPQSERLRVSRAFADYVKNRLLACPLVPGIADFLRYYRCIPKFVISGAPQSELRWLLEKRNLSRWFTGVYGSPRTKVSLTGSILNRFRIVPDNALWIGDALEDMDAATAWGVPFLGRVRNPRSNPFPPSIPTIHVFNNPDGGRMINLPRPSAIEPG